MLADGDGNEEEHPNDAKPVVADNEKSERISDQVDRILRTSYHPYHAQFDPVLRRLAQHFSQTRQYGRLRRVAMDMIAVLESHKGAIQVSDKAIDTYMWAGRYLAQCAAESNDGEQLRITGLEYLQKALDVHVMIYEETESSLRTRIEKSIQDLQGTIKMIE